MFLKKKQNELTADLDDQKKYLVLEDPHKVIY